MLTKLINATGEKTIHFVISFYDAFVFTFIAIVHLFKPASYNKQMRVNLITQIYHTSLAIPYFLLIAFFFGSISMGSILIIAAEYNLQLQVGTLIVNFIVNDFSALFSSLFIAFRSKHLQKKNISLLNTEHIDTIVLPSIISGIFNTLALSIILATVMFASAYVFIVLFRGVNFQTYTDFIFNALAIEDVLTLVIKSVVYGFVVMLIPLYLQKKSNKKNAILTILTSLFFLEMIFLLFTKVFHAL